MDQGLATLIAAILTGLFGIAIGVISWQIMHRTTQAAIESSERLSARDIESDEARSLRSSLEQQAGEIRQMEASWRQESNELRRQLAECREQHIQDERVSSENTRVNAELRQRNTELTQEVHDLRGDLGFLRRQMRGWASDSQAE